MLAVSSSCGVTDIYDAVLGTLLCSLPPVSITARSALIKFIQNSMASELLVVGGINAQ